MKDVQSLRPAAAVAVAVQVALSWHMMKLPLPALQPAAPLPGVRAHCPTTTPLLSVPVVVVVPLEVPVSVPGLGVPSVNTLPFVVDVTVKVSVPVTALVELVLKLALPLTFSALAPVAKQVPALKKPKPVTLRGPLLVTLKVVTKFSRLA